MEQMPFYMTFPMQNLYVMELEYEKDMERMKSLYPTEVAKIQAMIEERCDELEYEGGRIFDEEPDRYMMQEEVMKLYDRIAQGDMAEMELCLQVIMIERYISRITRKMACSHRISRGAKGVTIGESAIIGFAVW